MKILYLITQSELGGAQRYIFDLAKSFKKETDVLVCSGESSGDQWLGNILTKNNIKHLSLDKLRRDISLVSDVKALFQIRKTINDFSPDIVHLNSTKISILGSLACLMFLKKPKVVYTAHGWVFNENMSSGKKYFYKFLEKYTACLKDKIICVSDFDKNTALNIGIKNNKLKVIHNGIKENIYLNKTEARTEISKYIDTQNFNVDELLLGTIGNLYKNKGFAYLLNSIKRVLNEGYKLKLVIIGSGEQEKKLLRIIKEEGLENNVFLTGSIKNASSLLKAFDIYINSSLKEGLSYTVLEAMQAKLPIIVTDVGGNLEMIEDGINGLVTKSKNINDIAEKISYLLDNKNKADLYAMNSKEKLEYFSYDKMIDKTFSTYKSLTQK